MCHEALSKYHIETGVLYHKIDNLQFKEYIKRCRSNTETKHLGQTKYNNHVDTYHTWFKQSVLKEILENIASMNGFSFLNLMHNLLTSYRLALILGASVSFIIMHWEKRYLA